MPGFTLQLTDNDVWALIDFMKADAAGASIRAIGYWAQPVALPTGAGAGDCSKQATHSGGQRVGVILASARQPAALPLDDPRLRNAILADGALKLPAPQAGAPAIDCLSRSADAWQALSIITGIDSDQLAGTQLLTDRDGWLRVRKLPADSNGAWSESDILCRAPAEMEAGKPNKSGGLDGLIAAMDAEPVRFVKGGFVHATP